MAAMFKNFFRGSSKKHANKDNKENDPEDTIVIHEREDNRRHSLRSTTTGKNRDRRQINFTGDIPATAPYHVVTAPRTYRGPQSCPGGGGFREQNDNFLNRTLENNNAYRSSHSQRKKEGRSKYEYPNPTKQYSRRPRTSEYGSANPSPEHSNNAHYNTELEDTDNDDVSSYEFDRIKLEEEVERLTQKCHNYKKALRDEKAANNKVKTFAIDQSREVARLTSMLSKLSEENRRLRERERNRMGMEQNAFNINSPHLPFNAFPRSSYHVPLPFSIPNQPRSNSDLGDSLSLRGSLLDGAGDAMTDPADISALRNPINYSILQHDDTKPIPGRTRERNSFLQIETPRGQAEISTVSLRSKTPMVVLNEEEESIQDEVARTDVQKHHGSTKSL